jgi:hypothetical protein
MNTTKPTWATQAIKKHLSLSLDADSKRTHLLEIQRRVREVCQDIQKAQREVELSQYHHDFVDRGEPSKKRLAEAQAEFALLDELRKSLVDQVAQITPSVTAAVSLANACEQVLINLRIQRA